MDDVLVRKGWRAVESAPGVYVHVGSRSALIVDVDDMQMIARAVDGPKLWKGIGRDIQFCPAGGNGALIGVHYRMTP